MVMKKKADEAFFAASSCFTGKLECVFNFIITTLSQECYCSYTLRSFDIVQYCRTVSISAEYQKGTGIHTGGK